MKQFLLVLLLVFGTVNCLDTTVIEPDSATTTTAASTVPETATTPSVLAIATDTTVATTPTTTNTVQANTSNTTKPTENATVNSTTSTASGTTITATTSSTITKTTSNTTASTPTPAPTTNNNVTTSTTDAATPYVSTTASTTSPSTSTTNIVTLANTTTTVTYTTTAPATTRVQTTESSGGEDTTAISTTQTPNSTTKFVQPTTEPPVTTTTSPKSTAETTFEVETTDAIETTPPVTEIITDTTQSSSRAPSTPAPPSDIVLPICLTFFAIVLIIFFIVLYFYCTGKDLPCFGKKSGEHEIIELPPRKPSNAPKFAVGHMSINREEFEVQFKRKVADDGRGYREEYRAVQTESSTMAAARDPVNVPKNRYDNVLPWDSTRVVLSVPSDASPTDDYINANFVPGYLQDKKFIACQGPKDTTCTDFWRMMWDQKCATIVMVTNLVEAKKLKCHQYWPGEDTNEGETEKYGDFVVTLTDVKTRNFFVTRTFKLQQFDYPPRIIRQLHYTAWPDFGVPKNPHELLLFRRRVIAANPPHSGPIVVHCSAGVGRTGTYILIDAAMEQLEAEGKVDLFSFLTKMRKFRMMLVQTDAQYTFAHAAILEHIKYGNTEVSVKKFRAQVQSLREQVEGSDENLLEQQFSIMLKVQMNKENMKHGRQSIKKNRVLQIIPYDDNRVTLPLKPGQEKSDYINASFIDGFKEKRSFIATQGPLTETAPDFWSMAWVYNCQNIVMLTGLLEKGHEMCSQYWPSEVDSEKEFGDITVKYVSKDDDDVVDYVVREFVIKNNAAPEEEERKIRQFHYSGWPELGLPSDAHGMIEIANRLTSKDKDGYPRPTIVHCSSGGGRTGVFITLNILMEQADNEGLVDVFQVVKSLRSQRPHIIQTQEQFYFCYVALLQYLETNQMAEDSTTLTSNLNSSIGNTSQSVTPLNGGIPGNQFLGVENTTPQGSMNNKLDSNSISDQEVIRPPSPIDEPPPPPPEPDSSLPEPPPEIGSPESHGADSNQALLDDTNSEEHSNSNHSSQSDFEIVNETTQDNAVNV